MLLEFVIVIGYGKMKVVVFILVVWLNEEFWDGKIIFDYLVCYNGIMSIFLKER